MVKNVSRGLQLFTTLGIVTLTNDVRKEPTPGASPEGIPIKGVTLAKQKGEGAAYQKEYA